ncbi:MAG: cob(I)yrinic acid a,c-diamide adenosyltransferase [Kiritimatiellia bacterium]|nr:cob(I)yrinic acid a,c-diamide adenosyltransferase [Kiritimatiellia bacterium]
MSITTRTGDQGTTMLFSGEQVSKADPRLDALGDLDEVVSLLGVARACGLPEPLRDAVLKLQKDLFVVGAELASAGSPDQAADGRWVDSVFLADLEARRDALEAETPHPKDFILPGETPAGAQLDLARAVARRLERRVAQQSAQSPTPPRVAIWLNRLSDYLWLMARAAETRSRPLRDPS